jgi:hypothetical protein
MLTRDQKSERNLHNVAKKSHVGTPVHTSIFQQAKTHYPSKFAYNNKAFEYILFTRQKIQQQKTVIHYFFVRFWRFQFGLSSS